MQCTGDSAPESIALSIEPIASPTGAASAEPNLTVTPDGRAVLSWIENVDSLQVLKLAYLENDQWSEPKTVASGDDWFVNWADFPDIAVDQSDAILINWLQKSGPSTYAYDIQAAISTDRGNSWSAPFKLHNDSTQSEHGFVTMAALPEAGFGVTWLDGRQTVNEGGAQALRYVTVMADGTLSDEVLLDDRVCDCCQTGITVTGDSTVLIVYRGRSDDEIRDICVVRGRGDSWSKPVRVFADNWKIAGCPVNGPAVASSGSQVAVSWYTVGADTIPRVLVAFSNDYGKTFDDPIRIDTGEPVGRVDILFANTDQALVSWLEKTGDTARVAVRTVQAGGVMSRVATVGLTSPSRSSGFARMAATNDGIVIGWTVLGDEPHVNTALIKIK
jgi:hypothetical protein